MRAILAGGAILALAGLSLPTFAAPGSRSDVAIHRDTRRQLEGAVHLADAVAVAQAQADGPDGLPLTWCGDEVTAESTVNATAPASAAQFKVVYAYAADRPDRFAGSQDALQADVAITDRFLSAQSGGTRTIRFDMGTRCGPQYADIQVAELPRHLLRVIVTATDTDGTTASTSTPTAPVAAIAINRAARQAGHTPCGTRRSHRSCSNPPAACRRARPSARVTGRARATSDRRGGSAEPAVALMRRAGHAQKLDPQLDPASDREPAHENGRP